MITNAKIVSLNTSEKKGVIKTPNEKIVLKENHGVVDDAHAGDWHRQVSLLGVESYAKMNGTKLPFGSFAENITTKGIILHELPIGTKIKINDAILEVTQIGKECHSACEIKTQVGKCVMPKEGIFCKVIKGDVINITDEIFIL